MHTFFEVDGVEDFDPVRLIDDLAALILHGLAVLAQLGGAALEHFSALHQDGAFRKRFVKIENGKVTNYFQFRNSPLSHHHALNASSCPLRCPCFLC